MMMASDRSTLFDCRPPEYLINSVSVAVLQSDLEAALGRMPLLDPPALPAMRLQAVLLSSTPDTWLPFSGVAELFRVHPVPPNTLSNLTQKRHNLDSHNTAPCNTHSPSFNDITQRNLYI